MAWIVVLMAINIFNSNSRLKYKENLITSLTKRKTKKLVKRRLDEKEDREKLKKSISNLNRKHQAVLRKYRKDKSVKKIASSLKLGIRETRLVIKLYYKKGGETLW